jgi:hypothetical protein
MASSGFKMIATAICPTCKHEFWLLDEPMFDPGLAPTGVSGRISDNVHALWASAVRSSEQHL